MRKTSGIITGTICVVLVIGSVIISKDLWTDCYYCKDITTPLQACNDIGPNKTCGLYYLMGHSACCADTYNSATCEDDIVYVEGVVFYYRITDGTCSGSYLCKGGTSSPCPGDVIIASTNNCSPTGPVLSYTSTTYECD